MKSNVYYWFKYSIITAIGLSIPQLFFLAMVIIRPLWVFLETGMFETTILLFLIYYIVFSVIMGKKPNKYFKNAAYAIISFIVINFCIFSLFYFVLFYSAKEFSLDPLGVVTIVFISFVLMFVSIAVFLITSSITKSNLKKNRSTRSKTEKGRQGDGSLVSQ